MNQLCLGLSDCWIMRIFGEEENDRKLKQQRVLVTKRNIVSTTYTVSTEVK